MPWPPAPRGLAVLGRKAGTRKPCRSTLANVVEDGPASLSHLRDRERRTIRHPGPSTLFIVNNAVAYGWPRALGALGGHLTAIAILATLSVVGLGALIETYPSAFLGLRLAGASYILWLGWTFLCSGGSHAGPASGRTPLPRTGRALWLHSFGVGISNPKAVLFFAALFPQFLPANSGTDVIALLVATFVVVKFLVLGGYAVGARHVVRLFRKQEHARRGRMLTGLFFVAFGALMVWSALTDA